MEAGQEMSKEKAKDGGKWTGQKTGGVRLREGVKKKRRRMKNFVSPCLFPCCDILHIFSRLLRACECSALSISDSQEYWLSARLHWYKY